MTEKTPSHSDPGQVPAKRPAQQACEAQVSNPAAPTRSERALFAIGGRVVLVLVMLTPLVAFGLLGWLAWWLWNQSGR